MSAREQVIDALQAVIPADWRLIPYEDNTDVLDEVLVMYKQRKITKAPQAPNGVFAFDILFTIVASVQEPQQAEDELDENVEDLINYIDSLRSVNVTEATKVAYDDTRLAYDVTAQALIRREIPND